MDNESTKLLFVCTFNQMRSCTAEKIFEQIDGFSAKSAGLAPNAKVKLTHAHLDWADMIFVMEENQRIHIQNQAENALNGKPVINLDVSAEYGFMENDLVCELKKKLSTHLNLPENIL